MVNVLSWATGSKVITDDPADQDLQPLRKHVNRYRNTLLRAGVDHNGYTFQTDDRSLLNLNLAAQAARQAVVDGASATDNQWHGGSSPFFWIAADNTQVVMTPNDLKALHTAVFDRVNYLVTKADEIKSMDPIPTNFMSLF